MKNFTDLSKYPVGTKVKNGRGEIGVIYSHQAFRPIYIVGVAFDDYTATYTKEGENIIGMTLNADIIQILPSVEKSLEEKVDEYFENVTQYEFDKTMEEINQENQMEPEFINHSSYEFMDISSEEYRTYYFAKKKEEGEGLHAVTFKSPLKLAISNSGHRLFDSEGKSYFIPFGWIYMDWQAKPGQPNFVK